MNTHKQPPADISDRPRVVDLFAGAGGTGTGFKDADFQIVGAIEIEPNAARTYTANLQVEVKRADITRMYPRAYRKRLGLEKRQLDVLVGCPPCQGFSRMRNGKGGDDKRNKLVLRYLRFVEEFMPRFALFENVPGISKTDYGKKFYEQLCNGLEKLGYAFVEREVDVADYGVPQHRVRVILIAGRDGEVPPFPKPTHGHPKSREVKVADRKPWKTVRETIGNAKYPDLEASENGEQDGKYPNHIASRTGERVLEFIKKVPKDGGSRSEVPSESWLKCHVTHDGHKDVYGRLAWDRPANTITSGCNNPSKGRFVHPNQDRALTPREAAALQGFSDSFVFYGKRIATQIGNAVPPPLAYALAQALKEQIQAQLPESKCIAREAGNHCIEEGGNDKSNVRNQAESQCLVLPGFEREVVRAPEVLQSPS
jgi:DNA (cytosine-5)-methyltransferase 1